MDIEQRINLHFGEKVSGIVLDDAYDLWRKNRYIEYVKGNHVIYIFSRDADMRNLSDFSHIEYLTVPEEAEHLEAETLSESLLSSSEIDEEFTSAE